MTALSCWWVRAPPQRRGFLHGRGAGVFSDSSARGRNNMQLTGGIKMTKSHWRVLDLLAILLVASTLIGIIAIWTGAWWPFESLLLPEWPLLAFFAWFLATSTALALFGAHLQWTNVTRAASHQQQPTRSTQPAAATADPAFAGLQLSLLDRQESAGEELLEEYESEETEPVLAGSGM
jgi:hypothetical protein